MIEPQTGEIFYLRNDLGDHYEGKSVVVPAGTRGIARGLFPNYENCGPRYVFDVPESPGQKVLCVHPDSFEAIWTRYWSSEPGGGVPTRFERDLPV